MATTSSDARTSAGKFPLDVNQLRTSFLQSANMSERIRGFRVDRIIDIANDRVPVPSVKGAKVVLHIVPLGAFSDESSFDIPMFARNAAPHRPWEASGDGLRMTFDGAMMLATDSDGRATSYAHFFRNGILEAVTTSHLGTSQGPGRALSLMSRSKGRSCATCRVVSNRFRNWGFGLRFPFHLLWGTRRRAGSSRTKIRGFVPVFNEGETGYATTTPRDILALAITFASTPKPPSGIPGESPPATHKKPEAGHRSLPANSNAPPPRSPSHKSAGVKAASACRPIAAPIPWST